MIFVLIVECVVFDFEELVIMGDLVLVDFYFQFVEGVLKLMVINVVDVVGVLIVLFFFNNMKKFLLIWFCWNFNIMWFFFFMNVESDYCLVVLICQIGLGDVILMGNNLLFVLGVQMQVVVLMLDVNMILVNL